MINVLDTEQKIPCTGKDTLFLGEAPCSGETDLEILEEERQAVEALMNAYKEFCTLTETCTPYPQTVVDTFVDGIHRAQLAIGTIRFYHTLNQEYRLRMSQPDLPSANPDETLPELADEKLRKLTELKCQLEERLAFRRFEEPVKTLSGYFLEAWDYVTALTRQYPDQHVFDEFLKGVFQCEEALCLLTNPDGGR